MRSSVEICKINFKNPVIAASGTFGFASEYEKYIDLDKLGGICTKGLTLNKKEGNEGIRILETSSGILNSVGLQNPGIDEFLESYILKMQKIKSVVIANLGGNNIEEYVLGAKKLNQEGIDMIELNISCPNVKEGGMAFGMDSKNAGIVVREVKKVVKKPLIVKLSPNAPYLEKVAATVEEEGADAISMINTIAGMAIDIKKRKTVFENRIAGLSGPAIKPIAISMVNRVSKVVEIPIIGMGGITTGKDAIEFIMAGASAIQVGTANFIAPNQSLKIIEQIDEFLKEEKIKNIEEIIGII